ncbi:nitrous oxide-stimulated promoter family protein [Candidatus Stoquefichus massiliensis]|uniref:nitrous oxide-stimulated promoter family protein n=1 Tax=Candidatus Stoquefichus massiliensis TaxID=1470350 RepID=UPI00048358A1|nr:nitrous oxide-stimulated promoter family protein [Candidatus Stoquefichus massiliensis]
MNIESKRLKEIDIVKLMINLYCCHHNDINEKELIDYATLRIKKCPMIKDKTFCSRCKIHCYEKNMQEQIKKVMRYSGPRMIFHHPILAIKHIMKG